MASIDPIRVAKFFATVKHGGQTYDGLPYTHHLAAVETVVRRFRKDVYAELGGGVYADIVFGDLLVAAWLHDVVEDTPTKLKEIVEMFGEDVAELVGAVTNEKGENRKIRAALTYPKIRISRNAVYLKLADRIANVENGGKLVDMYRKEHEDFRRSLKTDGVADAMWAHLDDLLRKDKKMDREAGDT